MITIIAGSRDNVSQIDIDEAMNLCGWTPTTIISGTARGADKFGLIWAIKRAIPVILMPAEWLTYGKQAGYIRNKKMADNALALVAVWDGTSKGTKHMIDIAKSMGLKVYIHTPKIKPE